MKKMSFTLFEPGGWLSILGKSAFLVMFVWCFAAMQGIHAQTEVGDGGAVKMTTDSSSRAYVIKNCDAVTKGVQFTDDNGIDDVLYSDKNTKSGAGGVQDTVQFCAQDRWHRINVVFTEFDVAAGDSLCVYQGDTAALRVDAAPVFRYANNNGFGEYQLIGGLPAATTTLFTPANGGVGAAFGGWINAACDPSVNNTGCLTFIFKTTNDDVKGTGWDAWITCGEVEIDVDVTINNAKLECKAVDTLVGFPLPTISLSCGSHGGDTLADSTYIFTLRNASNELCHYQVVNSTAPDSVRLALGTYFVEYRLFRDSVKTSGRRVFSVSAPNLVCNDEVSTSLNSSCGLELALDDLLENPCDSVGPGVSFTVSLASSLGKGGTAFGPFTAGPSPITGTGCTALSDLKIWIDKEDLEKAGLSTCDGSIDLEISRTYTPRDTLSDGTMVCNNGPQTTSCTVKVNYSDETRPVVFIETTADTLIACVDVREGKGSIDSILAKVVSASALDNCSDVEPVLESLVIEEDDPCYSKNGTPDITTISITYSATDACGNKGVSDVTVLTVIRPNEEEHIKVLGDGTITADCNDDDSDMEEEGIGAQVGTIENGEFVVCDTVPLSDEEYVCGYIAIRNEDSSLPGNDCGRKKFINWSVLDWCEPSQGPSPVGVQFINFTDSEAPKFDEGDDNTFADIATRDSLTGHYFEAVLEPWSCEFDATTIPAPAATDNCDDDPTVTLHAVHRIETIVKGERSGLRDSIVSAWPEGDITKLDCDTFRFMYVVSDKCHEQHEQDTIYRFVAVVDQTLPSAVCTDQINVSIGLSSAKIQATDLDAGSFDACGIASILIRVKDSGDDFTEDLVVSCEDIHDDLRVELQVIDNKGNENFCWSYVNVEDKIAPICADLLDESILCNEEHVTNLGEDTDTDGDGNFEDSEWQDLEGDLLAAWNRRFGDPANACSDNAGTCDNLVIEQQYQLINAECGEARGLRRYRAIDWSGEGNRSAWAEQMVTIEYVPGWKITLPIDANIECTDAGVENPELPLYSESDVIIAAGSCDKLGVDVEVKEFVGQDGACRKLEVTYHIINWCLYEAGTTPVAIARIENGNGVVTEAQMVEAADAGEGASYWTYTRIITLTDNVAPEILDLFTPDPCIETGTAENGCSEAKTWRAWANDCVAEADMTWTARVYETHANGDIIREVSSTGALVDDFYTVTANVENKKYYVAEFWAADGCGNSGGRTSEPVRFWDCKQPTPYALNGIAISIMPTVGEVEVWASDLNQGSFDNCTPMSDLIFSIKKAGTDDEPTSAISFDCDELGTQSVEFYVEDDEGNFDFVTTYVIVQDNFGTCTDKPADVGQVAGAVMDAQGASVEDVAVSVNGNMTTSMSTQNDGAYNFTLPSGEDYTITPEKNVDPLNGVSTFDLVLISKHILGIQSFDTPYKYIAADVNKSGTITAFDMVQLRQLILNITTEFPNNTSWRFVDAAHQFGASPLSENFNEFISINNLTGDLSNVNFVAVKVGDVNANARPSSLVASETRTANGTLTLTTADRFVEAGEQVSVAFTAADIANVTGYQFTMDYAGLELAQLVEGVAKADNFNTNLRGALVTSWNGTATANDVLFTLDFTATAAGQLSELLSINNNVVNAEAYTTEGELMNVNINFTGATDAAFGLEQNMPNPFNAETVIGFTLPQAGQATLTVMDVQGKVLRLIEGDYAKGYNQIRINAKELGATGVLQYQLESANNVATKKMIVIE